MLRRYLTLCEYLLNSTLSTGKGGGSVGSVWSHLRLSVSYRLTENMASFVNLAMLRKQHIRTHKLPGAPVFYCKGNPFKIQAAIGLEIVALLSQGLVQPSDIFILAPSLKSQTKNKTPVKRLENYLVESGIPVYVPVGDDDSLQGDCAHGKVVFSTFHQCKGLERKVVFVFCFSSKYFDFFGKELPRRICPCALYVAATRATDAICFVAEGDDCTPLPFLDRKQLRELSNRGIVRLLQEPFQNGTLVASYYNQLGALAFIV